MGRPEGNRPLEGPTCRWEGNIKMDLREMNCDAWDCIDFA